MKAKAKRDARLLVSLLAEERFSQIWVPSRKPERFAEAIDGNDSFVPKTDSPREFQSFAPQPSLAVKAVLHSSAAVTCCLTLIERHPTTKSTSRLEDRGPDLHGAGDAIGPGVVGDESKWNFGGLALGGGRREIQAAARFGCLDGDAFPAEDDNAIEQILFIRFGETFFG